MGNATVFLPSPILFYFLSNKINTTPELSFWRHTIGLHFLSCGMNVRLWNWFPQVQPRKDTPFAGLCLSFMLALSFLIHLMNGATLTQSNIRVHGFHGTVCRGSQWPQQHMVYCRILWCCLTFSN